jgi:nitrile hydratase subunit beta
VTFRPGQQVRVAARPHVGHCRTPGYLRGKSGSVEHVHGAFTNPETRAYGGDGLPEQPLYSIVFSQRDVWPGYSGPDGDRISVDVYEHWLEEA